MNLDNEQIFLQMMFKRNAEYIEVVNKVTMLTELSITQQAQIKELEGKLLPPE